MHYHDDDDDYDDRSDDFRCYGCEANIGRGGYCMKCQDEMNGKREAG